MQTQQSTAKINARLPGSTIRVEGISQTAVIDFIKVERGLVIYYAISYWIDGKREFTTVHEDEVSDAIAGNKSVTGLT